MGCQMNEYDSDLVAQLLLSMGYLPTSDPLEADLILINTCAVRARAEQKAVSILGRVLKQKRRTPDLKVGLMGCVAQQRGGDLFKRFPELDLVLGTREVSRIREHIHSSESRSRVLATELNLQPPASPNASGYFRSRFTAFISIMEGCNNFCTYCVVPFTRGREASRSPDDIVEEAKHLVTEGVREITLLGQNVNSYSYGKEEGQCRFPLLLRKLSSLKELLRLRFTTSHPKDLSDDLIRCFVEIPNLCRHIHLPFQSGSNRILKRMNRGYTREQYIDRVRDLRQAVPSIAITSDVMVGFPGETEDEFMETLDLIRQIEFDNLYSFKYSDRNKTRSSTMSGKIDEWEKSRRLGLLQKTQKEITIRKNKSFKGAVVEVLAEGLSRKGDQLTGKTEGSKIVNFKSDSQLLGHIVKVLIKESSANSLRGECLDSAGGDQIY
ncbi:MAG: tRNA (N6-isopentenyl adenosine(37)-C2)-methylthiotransferase MiaB [Deltaproteobacteria bacterium HGW-Deltaproteobacteria-15]|nr:MAG: tRNA (N6-isopentenyl adenosine(37)-C2)-methylthiotransferase MiaB [Deltaproteobacteria bacterium HGW-Deltaproteobacteria-15]